MRGAPPDNRALEGAAHPFGLYPQRYATGVRGQACLFYLNHWVASKASHGSFMLVAVFQVTSDKPKAKTQASEPQSEVRY